MPSDRQRIRLWIVAMTMFLDLLGFGIIIPLMPHFARSFGATPLAYGMLAASYSLMQFLFVPVWGRLSDRVGRRPILLISIGGSVVSFLLLGMARSLGMLFAARILSGISASNLSVAQAYVADVTAPEERTRGMGLIGAAFGLGFVVGPFVGGELSQFDVALPLGLHLHAGTVPFFFSAVLSAVNWGLACAFLPESLPPANRTAAAIRLLDLRRLEGVFAHREISGLFAVSFLFTMAFSMMEQTLILFGEDRLGVRGVDAGKLLGFVGVLIVVVQGGGGGAAGAPLRRGPAHGDRRGLHGAGALADPAGTGQSRRGVRGALRGDGAARPRQRTAPPELARPPLPSLQGGRAGRSPGHKPVALLTGARSGADDRRVALPDPGDRHAFPRGRRHHAGGRGGSRFRGASSGTLARSRR